MNGWSGKNITHPGETPAFLQKKIQQIDFPGDIRAGV
jgi:hypothetical protein